MKIVYVGNRKNLAGDGKSFNTENHIALTLEKFGHEVDFMQEDDIVEGDILKRVVDADLFLWTRTWKGKVTDAELAAIKQLGVPTASFHLDKYAGIQRDGGLATDTFWKTDYVFSPEGSVQSKRIFEELGINQFYLPPGVFEDECYIGTPQERFTHDIVFVGGGAEYSHPEWPYRAKLVRWLQDTYGDRFGKYGYPQETVRGTELNDLYASAKIVIGDSLCKDFMDSYYFSDRAFETTGRGGFLIAPYIPGITDHFVDRKEIVLYGYDNFTQLKNLIDYYLEHDEERETIQARGHFRTKTENTYTNRMEQMLATIFPKNPTMPKAGEEVQLTGFGEADGVYTVGNGVDDNLTLNMDTPIKISLGAGSEAEEGFVNVDIVPLEGIDVVHNLMQYPWPFPDGCASYIKAKDIIEHMATHLPDGRSSLIAFIEECHRILQPGGTLWIQTPAWDSKYLWIDPTHVRGFDERTFDFFDPDTDFGRSTGFYSPCKYQIKSVTRAENDNLTFEMIKR